MNCAAEKAARMNCAAAEFRGGAFLFYCLPILARNAAYSASPIASRGSENRAEYRRYSACASLDTKEEMLSKSSSRVSVTPSNSSEKIVCSRSFPTKL